MGQIIGFIGRRGHPASVLVTPDHINITWNTENKKWKHFLTRWPWPFTYDLDLQGQARGHPLPWSDQVLLKLLCTISEIWINF